MTDNSQAILGVAGAIGTLIKLVADMLGEPVADVRKRVLAQVAADAADSRDETDVVVGEIDKDMPESSDR